MSRLKAKLAATLLAGMVVTSSIMASAVEPRVASDRYYGSYGANGSSIAVEVDVIGDDVDYTDILTIKGSCSGSTIATIHCEARMNSHQVKILADTYTNRATDDDDTNVLTGEHFDTEYSTSVSGTWTTSGQYLLSQVKISHIEESISASLYDIYLVP